MCYFCKDQTETSQSNLTFYSYLPLKPLSTRAAELHSIFERSHSHQTLRNITHSIWFYFSYTALNWFSWSCILASQVASIILHRKSGEFIILCSSLWCLFIWKLSAEGEHQPWNSHFLQNYAASWTDDWGVWKLTDVGLHTHTDHLKKNEPSNYCTRLQFANASSLNHVLPLFIQVFAISMYKFCLRDKSFQGKGEDIFSFFIYSSHKGTR